MLRYSSMSSTRPPKYFKYRQYSRVSNPESIKARNAASNRSTRSIKARNAASTRSTSSIDFPEIFTPRYWEHMCNIPILIVESCERTRYNCSTVGRE